MKWRAYGAHATTDHGPLQLLVRRRYDALRRLAIRSRTTGTKSLGTPINV